MCHTTRIACHHTTHRPTYPPPFLPLLLDGACEYRRARRSCGAVVVVCCFRSWRPSVRALTGRRLRSCARMPILVSCFPAAPPAFARAQAAAREARTRWCLQASACEAARGAPEVSRLRPAPIRACWTWPPHVASRFPNPITSFSRASAQLDSLLACHDDGARTLGPGDVRRGSGSRRYADGRRGGRLGIGDAASHVLLFGQRRHSIHRH